MAAAASVEALEALDPYYRARASDGSSRSRA